MNRASKKARKRAIKELQDVVRCAVNAVDPIGLVAGGAPDDEYDRAVGACVPKLLRATSQEDVQEILHEEYARWFGGEDAGSPEAYAEPAAAVWQFLQSKSVR